MGLSVSASAAIIFIASVIVFGTILGAFDNSQHVVLDAQRDAQGRAVKELNTHMVIVDLDEANGTLSIVNDGDVVLDLLDVDVFLNGSLASDRITARAIDGVGATSLWMPGETLVLSISGDLADVSIKVVCENGGSAYL